MVAIRIRSTLRPTASANSTRDPKKSRRATGESHGFAHAEAEPVRDLLLQGRGGEERDGVGPDPGALDAADVEHARADQPRSEGAAVRGGGGGVDGPVRLRREVLDLGLALAAQVGGEDQAVRVLQCRAGSRRGTRPAGSRQHRSPLFGAVTEHGIDRLDREGRR